VAVPLVVAADLKLKRAAAEEAKAWVVATKEEAADAEVAVADAEVAAADASDKRTGESQ